MTTMKLIIGNKNYSSWSLRPWILMKQFGLEFEELRVALYTETADKELEAYFSNFKVPVLVDEELIVWDSLAIMEYISDQYLHGKGWPTDLRTRACARSVSAEMHSSFTSLRTECPMDCREDLSGSVLSSATIQDIDRIKQLWRFCRQKFGQAGPWLFSDYTIADAMFAPIVLRFVGHAVELDQLESAYVETTLASPFIQEWMDAGKAEKEVINFDNL